MPRWLIRTPSVRLPLPLGLLRRTTTGPIDLPVRLDEDTDPWPPALKKTPASRFCRIVQFRTSVVAPLLISTPLSRFPKMSHPVSVPAPLSMATTPNWSLPWIWQSSNCGEDCPPLTCTPVSRIPEMRQALNVPRLSRHAIPTVESESEHALRPTSAPDSHVTHALDASTIVQPSSRPRASPTARTPIWFSRIVQSRSVGSPVGSMWTPPDRLWWTRHRSTLPRAPCPTQMPTPCCS